MSTRLLANPLKVHEVQDDMESFIHVQMYHCLRYSQHTLSGSDLALKELMEDIYHSYTYTHKGFAKGGATKKNLFYGPNGVLGVGFRFTASPLTPWFVSCAKAVSEWLLTMEGDLDTTNPATDKLLLRNHDALIEIWRKALTHSDWPEGDKAIDQVPNLGQKCRSNRKAGTDTETNRRKRSKGNTGSAIDRTVAHSVSSLQQIDE